MKPLTIDDVMPLQDHLAQRQELFEAHCRYVERYRRCRLAPDVTLVLENRQTIWFRVHEILRVARLSDPVRVQSLLDVYNALLPKRNHVQAALLIEAAGEENVLDVLKPWRQLTGERIRLKVSGIEIPARLITCRPEDRCFGTAHWVQFRFDSAARRSLEDRRFPVQVSLSLSAEHHFEATLSPNVRDSLIADLKLSDQDP